MARASYNKPNPNIHCGKRSNNSSGVTSPLQKIMVTTPGKAGYKVLKTMSFETNAIRTIASHNPELNPLAVACALATGQRVIGQFRGQNVTFTATI